jgi:hypothetical protein
MKFLFLALMLTSATAFACPSLAGHYSLCRSTTGRTPGSEDITIRQIFQGSSSLYFILATNLESQEREETSIVADGRIYHRDHVDPNTGIVVITRNSASCRQNILTTNQTVLVNGLTVSNINSQYSKSGGILRIRFTGQTMGVPLIDTQICE